LAEMDPEERAMLMQAFDAHDVDARRRKLQWVDSISGADLGQYLILPTSNIADGSINFKQLTPGDIALWDLWCQKIMAIWSLWFNVS
jgi:hypothetical protein